MKMHILSGGRLRVRKRMYLPDAPPGETLDAPVSSILLRHAQGNVLFDTGCHPDVATDPQGRWGNLTKIMTPLMQPGDNVINALEKMKKSKYKRRALLVITDAYDTSGKEIETLRAKIAEQEIQVFTCGVRSVTEELPNPTAEPLFQLVLRVLSADTGGLSMVVDLPELQTTLSVESLIAFSQIIAMELRGQYTLSYNTDQTGPLASRFVRVRTNIPQLRVRLRRDADEPIARPSK